MIKIVSVLFMALVPTLLASIVCADNAPAPSTSLPRIVVTGSRLSEEDYKVERLDSLGPMGSTPILDTPYSISVLPLNLIQNSMAVNFKDVSKYLPLVAYQEQQGPDILRPMTRGMQGGNFQNSKIDGLTMFITLGPALEQFQQIEVVNGVSASLYGPANPSGMFNFVTKRSIDGDVREFDVTYSSNSIGTAHVDMGGKFDKNGVIGYRFNAVYGGGGAFVAGSHQKRELGDLGLDIRPWENTVLEVNYTDYHLSDTGYPGWFTYGETVALPSPLNPKLEGYGQSYAGTDLRTHTSEARIKHDVSPDWHLVVGALNQDGTRDINTPVNNLSAASNGNYTSAFANGFAPRFVIASDTAYLNGTFGTFAIGHDVTLGTAGYRAQTYAVRTAATAASALLGTANINDPQSFPLPAAGVPNWSSNYDSSTVYQQGVNLGDTLTFGEQWSTRLGVSQDWFHTNNYSKAALQTSQYVSHGLSPTGSLIFKPDSNLTAYFTYASSLQAGDTAPTTAVNAGSSLAPYRSKEYELGYKVNFSRINFTAALFRIERPFANTDTADDIFKITGLQVNKGLELSAIGEMLPGLTIYGGVTLLNARLEHTPLAVTNDQLYVGTAKIKGNTLFEYAFPTIPGLVTVFNYQFSSPRPVNDTNTHYTAGYNLVDIGFRYTTNMARCPITWRLTVDNIADRRYWSTISPSNITGTNTGNLIAHLGAPRTLLAGASVEF